MMNRVKLLSCVFLSFLMMQACKQKSGPVAPADTLDSGTATFAADESTQPIVDEMNNVFTKLNTQAKPTILYRSENDVLRLLFNDSVRLVVLSRELTPDEKKVMDSKTLPAATSRFAIDAVTLIVNQASADTLITVSQIKKMLAGQTKTESNIVFDNANSSLVRYLKDFSGVKDFKQKNIYSLKNNKEVIKYVSNNKSAIGITGFSWLNDPDSDYADAVSKIKIVAVKDEGSKTAPAEYFKPSQNTLALKQYPLIRGLYVINSTGRLGLGTGFEHFLVSEPGQRVIMLSGLLPDSIPRREVRIKKTL